MGWINTENSTYWMPEVIPENTEEYKSIQSSKLYLKPNLEESGHPGWFYDNGSLVCDEYLFRNEGWKRIIENKPNQENGYKIVFDSWNELEDGVIEKKYILQELTDKEIVEIDSNLWILIRNKRNQLLNESDYIVTRALERDLQLTKEFKDYREELRNITQEIDIKNFNLDEYVWPSLPSKLYIA